MERQLVPFTLLLSSTHRRQCGKGLADMLSRILRFQLLFICFVTTLARAEKQCRIVKRGQVHLAQSSATPTSTTSHRSGSTAASSTAQGGSASGTASGTASATASPTVALFDYANTPIRGVNLGGWLVLEPWITPSFFEATGNDNIVDEFTLGQLMPADQARAALEKHWDTWITEDDFVQMKNVGLNHVRIPLGYWSIPIANDSTQYSTDPSPYIVGAWPYFLRGLNWAKKHGLHTLVDIHGAPGSQNGYDNSGQRTNDPQWANGDNPARTVDYVRYLVQQAGGLIDVLELLNEGAGFRGDNWASAARKYFSDGYSAVRQAVGDDMVVMIGDAFLGVSSWTGFLTAPNAQRTMMDYHEYQIFSQLELSRSWDDHINYVCQTHLPTLTSFASSNIWTVIGEWSNAPTDCARWLNGRGVGARWDGTWYDKSIYFGSCDGWTGDGSKFSDDYKKFLRKYWEVQVEVGEAVQGWIFWTWKTEEAAEWSYQQGVQGGWIPSDPTNRLYPNICSGSKS